MPNFFEERGKLKLLQVIPNNDTTPFVDLMKTTLTFLTLTKTAILTFYNPNNHQEEYENAPETGFKHFKI